MYRSHYPVFYELWRSARRALHAAAGLITFFITVELVRAYQLFYGFHPLFGYSFAGLVLLVAVALLIRQFTRRRERQTLAPPLRPDGRHLRQEDLVAYTSYLIHRLKRLSLNTRLEETARKNIRQRAYDLEALLVSHPLIEDLTRAISKAEAEVLEPVFAELDEQAAALGKTKIRSIIEDVVEPPFPVITPLVVLYHQVTLITSIAELYLGPCSLREYGRVLSDVEETSRQGDFFRIGQRLFEGAYVSSPPLGRAVDDLGQGITCTWLTWSVTKAAAYRCRALTPWSLHDAVYWLDSQSADSLTVVRDVLINDVLPLLKLRIRHMAGPGLADSAGFSEQVTQSVAKAVDSVVKAVKQNPVQVIQQSRRTHHNEPLLVGDRPVASRSWHRRGLAGVLRSFLERVRYSRRHKKWYN